MVLVQARMVQAQGPTVVLGLGPEEAQGQGPELVLGLGQAGALELEQGRVLVLGHPRGVVAGGFGCLAVLAEY